MSQANADRNLLLGILAYQNAFVTRDALFAGMQAWLYDKEKPLAEILQGHGALAAPRRPLLEALVAQHLKQHGGDARNSLQAVNSASSVRQDLEQMPDPDLQASLVYLAQPPPDDDPFRTRASAGTPNSAGTPTSAGTRFRRVRPHAKGGLGEVFVALDSELNREVALKEIQGHHADEPASRARFLLEAEITGGLEHPGIVPVYGLGTYADGRPFYAMRFIRGDSLMEAIAKYHKPQTAKTRDESSSPAGDVRNLQLRNLLRRLIDVCNALQYAHDRGVLHRDLKPGNIMLGKYGETLVVDWGLAKARGSRKPGQPGALATQTGEAPLVPASASGSAETVAGSAIGTPAFMSPEQAAGRLDLIGPGSDVYSLGATLYCVLTGRASVQGGGDAVLKQVQGGNFAPPRQIAPGVAPALEAVCLKAMSLQTKDRYGSPRELAEDLERWLADEPVHAWPEPWTVKTGRWMRQHKPVVSGAAAAALVGMVALTAGVLWYQHEQNRRAGEAIQRQAEADHTQAEADRKRALAEAGIRQALDQAEQVRGELHAILQKPGGVFGLLNDPARWKAHIQAARASLDRARALLANGEEGLDPLLAERAAKVDGLLRRDESDRLLAVSLEKVRMDRSALVDGKFDNKKADEAYPRVFTEAGFAVLNGEPAIVAARLSASQIKEQLLAAIDDWAFVASTLGKTGLQEELLHIGRLAAPDPAWGDRLRQSKIWRDHEVLAALMKEMPEAGLSPPLLDLIGNMLSRGSPEQEAWLRRAQAQYPSDFWLNFNLGNALHKAKPVEATGFYRVAVAVRPGSIAAYSNFGNALAVQKLLPEAVAAYRKAIELDPQFAAAYSNRGGAFYAQKLLPEAVAASRKAIELDPQGAAAYSHLGAAVAAQKHLPEAVAAFRKAIELHPQFGPAYSSLGSALLEQKHFPQAEAAFRKAIELDPQLAPPYFNLGYALYAQKRLPDAVAAYRMAIELDPKVARSHTYLGGALYAQKRLPEAIAAYRKAIELDPQDASAYSHIGAALAAQKYLPEAVAAFRKAIDLDPQLAPAYSNLGGALYAQKRLPEAIAAYRKAIELDPHLAPAHSNLGDALYAQKQLPEAIAAYRKAIELDPQLASAYSNLGDALADQKRLPDAVAAYRMAIELDPKAARFHTNLGGALYAQKRLAEAIVAYRKAIDLDPKNALNYSGLGGALVAQKQLPEAVAAFRRAIEVDPQFASAYCNLGVALADQKQLPEAVAAYRKAIEISPNLPNARLGLGLALLGQGLFGESTDTFRKAVELLPPGHPLRQLAERQLKQCVALQSLEKRIPAALEGKDPATPAELLQMAVMCQQYKQRHATAVQLYQQAFEVQPALAQDATSQHRYNAAYSAALAGAGQGEAGAKVQDDAKAKLRQQARAWLQADLYVYAKLLSGAKAPAILQTAERLSHWQADAGLDGVRDAKALAGLSEPETKEWQKLWADVAGLLKEAAGRFTESRMEGALTSNEKSRAHEWTLVAGRTYVLDLESPAFDAFLKLHAPDGKLLAENDDIAPDNQNSRLIFTAPADGVYRIVATSFEQAGVGAYTLRIREFKDVK